MNIKTTVCCFQNFYVKEMRQLKHHMVRVITVLYIYIYIYIYIYLKPVSFQETVIRILTRLKNNVQRKT